MQEAKRYVQELQDREEQRSVEEKEDALEGREKFLNENLKVEINSLLIQCLPDHITVKDADTLACVIYDMIRFPENYLK